MAEQGTRVKYFIILTLGISDCFMYSTSSQDMTSKIEFWDSKTSPCREPNCFPSVTIKSARSFSQHYRVRPGAFIVCIFLSYIDGKSIVQVSCGFSSSLLCSSPGPVQKGSDVMNIPLANVRADTGKEGFLTLGLVLKDIKKEVITSKNALLDRL